MTTTGQQHQQLHIVPMDYDTAARFVRMWHRHHPMPRPAHRFSLGVATPDRVLRGVAMIGNPVARPLQDGRTLEVNRTATDGTPNANSALYAAAWRAAKALGWCRLITYTQAGESGASLRGAGWRVIAERPPRGGWDTPARPRENRGTDGIPRTLWEAG